MAIIFNDEQIQAMVAERKYLPADWTQKLVPREKSGHVERQLEVLGADGNRYVLIVRRSLFNPNDFSIILGVRTGTNNRVFRLRRHNGKSHEHTNSLEGDRFFDFHIHYATERYQDIGHREPREDAYALVTDRYVDATGALECLIGDAGFEVTSIQRELFLAGPEV